MRGVMRRAVGVLPSRAGTVIYPVQRLSELLNVSGGVGNFLLASCMYVCVLIWVPVSLFLVVPWQCSYHGEVQGSLRDVAELGYGQGKLSFGFKFA